MTYYGTVTFGIERKTEDEIQDAIELIQSIISREIPELNANITEDTWEDEAKIL